MTLTETDVIHPAVGEREGVPTARDWKQNVKFSVVK